MPRRRYSGMNVKEDSGEVEQYMGEEEARGFSDDGDFYGSPACSLDRRASGR